MSHPNPTALRLGMSGVLDGRKYTVLGRVVYGVVIESETYFWQEFHLSDMAGQTATLVFEDTEDGPTWKFFKRFQPATPFSVRDAAAKKRGEGLNLNGRPVRVTLLGVSKVYRVEGDAPPGVQEGDVDNYLNAETDRRMVVVSWRGEKIEFFDGRDLPRGTVEAVFGLPPPRRAWRISEFFDQHLGYSWDELKGTAIFVGIIVFWVLTQFDLSYDPGVFHPEPPPKQVAPGVRFPIGARGQLAGKNYAIVGSALAEVAQPGKRFERCEYILSDELGKKALLLQVPSGTTWEWRLFRLGIGAGGYSPQDHATTRKGWSVDVDGRKFQVMELFMESARQLDGQPASSLWPSSTLYGYVAISGRDLMILRWSETTVWVCLDGRSLSDREVEAALGKRA